MLPRNGIHKLSGLINEIRGIPKIMGKKSLDILLKNGISSELYFFDGGHEINNEIIEHCRKIIKKQFLS